MSIGVVSFTKRDYLEHHDIGFALLPHFSKQGYAFESTKAILETLKEKKTDEKIVAITLKENNASIKLLEKLGLVYNKEIILNEETLYLYVL